MNLIHLNVIPANWVSTDGVLDLSGNVLEWTRSLYHYPYPYQPEDGREKLFTESEYKKAQGEDSNGRKIVYVLRGGSFNNDADDARCAFRHWDFPSNWSQVIGFRVVVVFSRASR